MNMQSFLDELIKTGKEYAEKGQKMAEDRLNISEEGDKRDATLDGMKKGAIAAGALALLLGTNAGRKLTGSALKIGSIAAVGGIAYQALQNWQKKQAEAANQEPVQLEQTQDEVLPVDRLEGEEAEARSKILIKAMIAAAKSDGNIDEAETAVINKQIQKLGLGTDIEDVMQAGMVMPLSAKSVAKMADNKETAAEIYVVSMLVTDDENSKEKRYMNELADALELPAEVISELESYRK